MLKIMTKIALAVAVAGVAMVGTSGDTFARARFLTGLVLYAQGSALITQRAFYQC